MDNAHKLNYLSEEQKMYLENEFCKIDDDTYYDDSDNFYFSLRPKDIRIWNSIVEDISGGDNFISFCEDYFRLLEIEGYYDN